MNAEPQHWIRVLLLDNATTCSFKTKSPFIILNQQSPESHFGRFDTPTKISISAGKITIAGRSFVDKQITILPDDPHIFTLNGTDYRGKLRLIRNPNGKSFDVINLVPLEPYLAGVIGAEMPDYWEPHALKTQAIAARTYCLYIKNQFGKNRTWDVTKTQANQVYLGIAAESNHIWNAVNQTKGQVLICKHPDGKNAIFPTYYSSACGGHTENSKNVFGDSFEPLAGVPCPYCKNVSKPGVFYWPTVQFDKKLITTRLLQKYPKLKHLGQITNVTPAKQSKYRYFSRLTLLKLHGSTGKNDFLRAEDFRLSIDPTGRKLKSTIFHIVNRGDKLEFLSGRGFGHGVGMCQCGAQGFARKGKSASQILAYYYPGSKIINIY